MTLKNKTLVETIKNIEDHTVCPECAGWKGVKAELREAGCIYATCLDCGHEFIAGCYDAEE